jgi:hypothetical protein
VKEAGVEGIKVTIHLLNMLSVGEVISSKCLIRITTVELWIGLVTEDYTIL